MWSILLYIFTGLNLLIYLYIIFVIAKKWNTSKSHRRFFWFSLLSFLWILDVVFQAIREDPLTWTRYIFVTHINFVLAALVAGAVVSFAIHFPRDNTRVGLKKELLLLLPLIILAILSCTNLFVKVTGFRAVATAPAYPIYIIIIFIYSVIIAGWLLIKKIRINTGIIHTQLLYITIGYMTGIIVLIAESIYMNVIDVISPDIDLLATDISFLFAALAAYAMLRYRFMEVRVIIRKGVIYSVSLLFTLAIYTYFAIAIKDTIARSWNINTTWTVVILIALVALGFPPLKNLVEKAINTIFKGKKQIDLAVKELRKKVASEKEYDKLINIVKQEIIKYLGNQNIQVFIMDHQLKKYVEYSKNAHPLEIGNDFTKYFEKTSQILVREEIPHLMENQSDPLMADLLQRVGREMNKLKAGVIIALKTEIEVFGFIILGELKANQVYSVEDIQFLEKLREQISYPIAYALLYRDAMERINNKANF